ncbi:uncharacterized protein ACRADG_002308 [Cochliomyia hominivorax]
MFKYKSLNVNKTHTTTSPTPSSSTAIAATSHRIFLGTSTATSTSTSSSSATCSLCPLYKNILCLIIGLIIGIRFTDIWFNLQNETTLTTILQTTTTTRTTSSASFPSSSSPTSSSSSLENNDDSLFNTTKVLCWILTNPTNHLTKAIHIRHTWGRRCNKLLFMSTEEDEILSTIKLDVEEGRENLWNKTQMALKYIYDHYIDEAEWFLKADDDTYVILENLRYFLYQYPSEAPIYFGAKFKQFVKQGYMSGGAGYVLSREALKKFALEAYDNPITCPETYQAEDVQLGLCLQNIGVIAGDSRDEEGNERFLPLPVEYLIPEDKTWWYKNYSYYPQKENASCCSSSVITFHYIKPEQFYVLDYFLYNLRIFGISNNFQIPKKLPLTEVTSEELNKFQPIPEPPFESRRMPAEVGSDGSTYSASTHTNVPPGMEKHNVKRKNMLKLKSFSHSALGSLYRNLICLTLGLLIGIRVTSFWYNLQNTSSEISDDYEIYTNSSSLDLDRQTEFLSQYLFNTTRVLCWIMTNPANHMLKAIHIRHTWGKRCNKLLFISTREDEILESVKLDVEEGRHNLWNKTKVALKYIYDHHYDDAEWFLKADDDTYVILENLRYLLYRYSPEIPIYFGAKFKPYVKQGYMSGGAGYVLSKESLRKFALEAYDNPRTCPKIFKSEDVQLGFCLQNIDVIAGDSRDDKGNERFMPLAMEHLIPNDYSKWYRKYSYYPQKKSGSCCSSSAISFHYIEPYQFYVLDYLIYTLKTFATGSKWSYVLPEKFEEDEIIDNIGS